MADTKVILTVRNRTLLTVRAIESLLADGESHEIVIFDNGSDRELSGLLTCYDRYLWSPRIGGLYFNREPLLRHDYWTKATALNQAKRLLALLPPEEREFVAVSDNDVAYRPGWLTFCRGLLNHPRAAALGIRLASPWHCPCQRTVLRRVVLDGLGPVLVKAAQGGACWVMRGDDFLGLPDWPTDVADDAWLWREALARGWRYGVREVPLAFDISNGKSERLTHGTIL